MNEFQKLGLDKRILNLVELSGYNKLTAIQAKAIPPIMEGSDLFGIAQTGTGKTATFALPLINKLLALGDRAKPFFCQALILAPTRELAAQIHKSFHKLGRDLSLRFMSVYGGVNEKWQIQDLEKGAHIIIATPGRLLDLMGQGAISLDLVHTFILDEADRMLDMGFRESIEEIIEMLPPKRQNLLFSATMGEETKNLAKSFLTSPCTVEVDPARMTVKGIDHKVIFCDRIDKPDLLKAILAPRAVKKVLIFARTKKGTNRIRDHLESFQIKAAAIHGDKSQAARERSLHLFKSGMVQALVATDIAARGIDIDDIGHVINYDLPLEFENYIHRIGRTGRAGKTGSAISFCDNQERALLEGIEKLIKEKIPTQDNAKSIIEKCTKKTIKVAGKRLSPEGRPLRHPDLCRKKKIRKNNMKSYKKIIVKRI